MAISIEYLAIFRRTDTFCDSADAFTRLLQVNSDIVVENGTISFKKQSTCKYELTGGDVAGKGQRYLQLRFTWDGDPDVVPEGLDRFLSLLKAVRAAISCIPGEVETLHDDVSTHYASRAYPLIHNIENLMRRLIANFMLVNVGIEWTAEALPSNVEEAIRKSNRKPVSEDQPEKSRSRDYLNVLYTLDFLHLGNILFDAYSKNTPSDLYIALKTVKTVADAEALQDFIPQSNWTRYFAQIINCEDQYLDSRWKKLYLLRCKVAHNALMGAHDLADLEKLIGEVKPKLLEAIGKLPQVTVPPGDVERVAESAARNVNTTLGEFVSAWQQLEAAIARRVQLHDGVRKPVMPSAQALREQGILDDAKMDLYDEVRLLRNRIVHAPALDVPLVMRIQAATADIRLLADFVKEESVIAKLRAMDESERDSAVEAIVTDSLSEITESEEFCNAQAVTNAVMFTVDDLDILDVEFTGDECLVKLSYAASGEQLEDKVHYGGRITGEAEAVIDWHGSVTFQDVTASVDHGETEEDEFEAGDFDGCPDESNGADSDPEENDPTDDAWLQ